MPTPIEIYTTPTCPYCLRAKALLAAKGLDYVEFDVWADRGRWAEMIERSGRRTVPQIFIGGVHVGGSDELHALDQAGRLDALLAA